LAVIYKIISGSKWERWYDRVDNKWEARIRKKVKKKKPPDKWRLLIYEWLDLIGSTLDKFEQKE
jgi:hypothetical protein